MPLPHASADVFAQAVAGDRRALARAISRIEDRADGVLEAVADLSARRASGPGAPHVIGLTGPPGAGKSTFTNQLITAARARGERVGVVAVDPSSPFSGGAILGDRVRMEQHVGDSGVFIRSLASRGHLGGLSRATGQVVELMDAVGMDLVVIETVGVGQSELSVMEVADTVMVVLTPESGDTVQTMKAGLLEVADVFVVNKADRPGAAHLARELEAMVRLDGGRGGVFGRVETVARSWLAPVCTATATTGEGVGEALTLARSHLVWCCNDGLAAWHRRRGAGRVRTFLDLVAEAARRDALERLAGADVGINDALFDGALNPYLAASRWRVGP